MLGCFDTVRVRVASAASFVLGLGASEALLDGEKIPPNKAANTAYKQRFVDYLKDNQEKISFEQFTLLSDYVLSLDEIITRNMVAQANQMLFKQQMDAISGQQEQPQPEQVNVNKTEDIINTSGEVSPEQQYGI